MDNKTSLKMTMNEVYWQQFDANKTANSNPFHTECFCQDALHILREMDKHKIPTDRPDPYHLSKGQIARIDEEARDIHCALNYPTIAVYPSLLDTTCARANRNGDACAVYNRLPKRDQDKMELEVTKNTAGMTTFALKTKAHNMKLPYIRLVPSKIDLDDLNLKPYFDKKPTLVNPAAERL